MTMKEINIAKVLLKKRKEKGITQDELADFIGVTKASVSKWETGQSYPDVTFLPRLAAYFNISIDELMAYEPQMAKEEIRKLYRRLSADFAAKPFDTVMDDCRQVIHKYYSCFPLLLQMGMLMVNHAELQKDPQQSASLLEEAKVLFIRVRQESGDVSLTKQALFMEALCSLATNDPNAALELLDGTVAPALPPESILASAYQMTGRIDEAKSVLQVGIYQNIVVLFNFLPAYLGLCTDAPEKFEEVLRRALHMAEVFDLKRLHPGVLVGIYISAAQGYLMQGNHGKALDMLQQYTELVTGNIYPLSLHGDDFFDLLERWLDKLDLGTDLPRDEKTIRQSMANGIVCNPVFSVLSDEPRFRSITEKLQNNCQ
ncbi:helix-turn-helix domain-containing protein [Desulfitobacterium chlororespirans]|uniref:Helix-turn-helix n=1 Tax=Desulfitobacterium chlororespirans DSM 11544 TaxID=1121395 RepID=A0A1M7TID8_9FIRM|nr:helix-turn-helix transcriptional regulator [Desulfitobacterium chlororespirans]SHN70524.1 Helix-turn-helix [Desulfitobacterium chlororespirans DSM 11544]